MPHVVQADEHIETGPEPTIECKTLQRLLHGSATVAAALAFIE